ncbi:MAG: hypothetical protein NTX04_05150, partial [Verrucomicrobia bacterium]|nr:hypothetical protein [Verrucomicrobiota bacterium]
IPQRRGRRCRREMAGAAVEFSAIATYHPLTSRPFTIANGTQTFTTATNPAVTWSSVSRRAPMNSGNHSLIDAKVSDF